jgi:hypothetical protein
MFSASFALSFAVEFVSHVSFLVRDGRAGVFAE